MQAEHESSDAALLNLLRPEWADVPHLATD